MAFFSWWYGDGWQRQGRAVTDQLKRLLDTFSFGLLLRTLFSPFRQISAGRGAGGPLGVQLSAWFDRQLSRFIGALVRTALLFTGVIVVSIWLVAGAFRIALWPFVPLLPVVVSSLWAIGWLAWI